MASAVCTRLRLIAPWLTPTLVVIEIGLVAAGVLTAARAIAVFVAIEVMIAVVGVSAMAGAVTTYRRWKQAGREDAAGAALSMVLPRRVARAVVTEVRVWQALILLVRRDRFAVNEFSYGSGLRPLLYTVIGLLVVEGAIVEIVLAAIVGDGWWTWVFAAIHLYAFCWIVGILASLRTRPHVVSDDEVLLRDSIFGGLCIPRSWISDVRVARTPNTGRSGLVVDDDTGTGRFCHGDGTAMIELDEPRTINGICVRRLAVSPNQPNLFAASLRSE